MAYIQVEMVVLNEPGGYRVLSPLASLRVEISEKPVRLPFRISP
jgi:hypothetical protein